MSRVPHSANDEHHELDDNLAVVMDKLVVTTYPVAVCGVQRKTSLGGGSFENIDIYYALALPLPGLDLNDKDALQAALIETADFGFKIASTVTLERYLKIKEGLK